MSLVTNSFLSTLGVLAGQTFSLDDNKVALAAGTQAGATPILGNVARFTKGGAGASAILKSIISGEAPPIVFVINDTATTVLVFPAAGEKQNNSANASLSIAAGAVGIFIRAPNPNADWRSGVIT